jgi:hypothetical protein
VNSLVDDLPGDSELIERVRSEIALAARTDLPVLLVGETGTGKNVAARLIHNLSTRKEHPFVAVNMGAIPSSLASDELVGHTKGAFTGAVSNRLGLFQQANRGSIFLDEIGEAPNDVQAIVLSILDTRSVRPLGGASNVNVDVRVIAATNRDIRAQMEVGNFRPDLYNRIAAIVIRLPPLRERPADIPALAARILAKISPRLGRSLVLAPSALKALRRYSLPGNYRELENLLERAAVTASGPTIDADVLGLPSAPRRKKQATRSRFGTAARRQVETLQAELEAVRATSIAAQPIWQGRRFGTRYDYCFVLMPFGDVRDLQAVYRDHVRPVIERCGLRCGRADDIYDVSGVMQSVWEGINRARLVVADLTERNANVFYELGIAHTLGKPVIMLSQSIDFVPFDLRHLRCIVYTYTPRGADQLEQALERTIKTVLSSAADLGTT